MEVERLMSMGEKTDINKLYDTMLEINKTDSKTSWYGKAEDCKFLLREGATEEEIDSLKRLVNYPIPEDYLQFLRLTNGLQLNSDSHLCDIGEVISNYKIFFDMPPKNIIIVGIFMSGVHICIDLKAPPEKCMYITEPIGLLNAYGLDCSFTKFLSRYITCYGAAFWLWGVNYENKINTSPLQYQPEDGEEDESHETFQITFTHVFEVDEQGNNKKS